MRWAMAARGGKVFCEHAVGKRALSSDREMTLDSVFWIASMTKAITAAAAMQMVEQGKLSLDAPIAGVLPDLDEPQVLEGFSADGAPKLRPARRPITLRHLLTHTAGFCYDMWNGDMLRYLQVSGLPRISSGKNDALKTPIASDPGTRWEYGTNIDFAGKAVEVVSGLRLDVYLRDHLLEPLGMRDTGFKLTPELRERRVGMHTRNGDKSLLEIPHEVEQNPEFHVGGSGLSWHRAGLHKVRSDDTQRRPVRRRQNFTTANNCSNAAKSYWRTQHDADEVLTSCSDQRYRILSRYRQEMGSQLHD